MTSEFDESHIGILCFVTKQPIIKQPTNEPWTSEEWLAFVDWSMQQEPQVEGDVIEKIL